MTAAGTLSVLESVRQAAPQATVLLISRAEVYGHVAGDRLPISESEALAPVSPYAASKVASEYLGVQAWLGHGVKVIRARPFNHIGPGQSRAFAVPALASRIIEARSGGSKSITVGNLSARRDLTDVRDIVRAYRMMVVSGAPGAVYNVCSGIDLELREVVARLLELAGADLELVADPDLMRPVDVPVVRGDPTELVAATGWRPSVALDQTLQDILDELTHGS